MMRMRRRNIATRPCTGGSLVLGMLLALAAAVAHADTTFDADAGYFHDSNVSRALASDGMRADDAASGFVAARALLAPTAADGVTLSLDAGGETYRRYSGLDNGWASASVAWRRKFGLGHDAPWFRVEALAAYYGYDVDLRSGPRFVSRVAFGRRFGETWSAQAGAYYDQRWSSHGAPQYPGVAGDVYNLRGKGVYAAADVALGNAFDLGANAGIRRGDVASTASEWSPILPAATAVSADPTFGDELYVYRLRGTTLNAELTLSYALGDHASINLSYSGERTGVAQGYDYRSHATRLAWLYRY